MNDKDRLKECIRTLVKEELVEVSPVFYPAIKKGMEAGKKASQRQVSSYRGPGGQSFADEIGQIQRDAARKHNMRNKMSSLSKYMKKVFSGKSSGGTASARVKLDNGAEASITAELTDGVIFGGVKFVVRIRKDGKEILKKDFPAGIGAKQNIARLLKKINNKQL